MLNFNKRLKVLRKEKRRTQEDVAKFLNIKRATYSGYERGVIMPPYDKINALAKYFNVTVEHLMGEKPAHDVSQTDAVESLSKLVSELKTSESNFFVDGILLDEESKNFLINSLENSINMTKYIAKNNKKG